MLTIVKKFSFEASHSLQYYEGKCANMHGHSYFGEVGFEVIKLNEAGIAVDFGDLKKLINEVIIDKYCHKNLNDVFGVNSTVEVMTLAILQRIKYYLRDCSFFDNVRVRYVLLHETADSHAIAFATDTMKEEIEFLTNNVKQRKENHNESK